jgi:hypothetical protein
MFVDWAGPSIPIYDRETGVAQPASLFVAVLAQLSQLRTFFGFFVMIFVLKSCVFIVGI